MKLLKFFATFLFILSLIQVPFATAQTPTPVSACLSGQGCYYSQVDSDGVTRCYIGDKLNANGPTPSFNNNCGWVPGCRDRQEAIDDVSCQNLLQVTPSPTNICSGLVTNPTSPTINDRGISLTINTPGLSSGNYKVYLQGNPIRQFGVNNATTFNVQNGQINIPEFDGFGFIGNPDGERFNAESYRISVNRAATSSNASDIEVCVLNFTVASPEESIGGGDKCSIEFDNNPSNTFTYQTALKPYIINPSNQTGEKLKENRRMIVKQLSSGRDIVNICEERGKLVKDQATSIGTLPAGKYSVEYTTTCGYLTVPGTNFQLPTNRELVECKQFFNISGQNGLPPGGVVDLEAQKEEITNPPCAEGGFVNGKCTKVNTAIGTFDVEIAGFIRSIFSFILGIAGGIALLLIIYSGYQMLTSQGNPEAIQGAKETITSAIVGLLFIIFSFVILTIIGVDILKIPGFSQ